MSDEIKKPSYYTYTSVECMNFVSPLSFPLGNAIKYLWRHGRKGDEKQAEDDLKKALENIDRLIVSYEKRPIRTRIRRFLELKEKDKRLLDVSREIKYGFEIRILYNHNCKGDLIECKQRLLDELDGGSINLNKFFTPLKDTWAFKGRDMKTCKKCLRPPKRH